jgi:threonine/homoserine/homoserine lactone efflux protein
MIFGDPLFVAFLSFTFVFVATPGATTAVVVRNTLDGGRRAGLFAALGAAGANITHATIAGLGGAALLRTWPGALEVVRLAGGGYLGYLGLRSLWLAYLGEAPLVMAFTEPRRAHHRSLREGLTVNLLGPVILTFYLTVVPTFIRPTWPRGAYVLLAVCHVAMAFACHSAWVLALHRMRALFRHAGPRRVLGAATGVALLLLAARVLRTSAAG